MATAYTSLLGLALPVTGELSGSWGDIVNDSITSLLDSAISGTTSLTTDADVTLTTTTGAANQARQSIILWNPASGSTTRNITAPAQSKIYTVINASGGTQSIVFRGAGPTTGVTIIKGESAVVAWNGSDFIKISNTGGGGSFTNVTISGTTTLSGLTASTALALNASKEVVSVTNTGTGNNVLSASPTLTGTLAAAAATFSGAVALGDAAADNITVNGTVTSNLIFTDNTYDIGASGATRPRNLYLAGDATVGGNIVLTGSLDLTNLEVTNIKAKDGTAGMQIADSTGVVSFTANPVMSGGTANGVAYLNGSKVLTTGSALTFDGTNLSSTGGATFQGGPTGYGGGEVRLGTTASGQQSAISTLSVDSPVLVFDHRGTSNTGVFVWRNGTGGANELARLTSTGLGIGTSSPQNRLDIGGPSAGRGLTWDNYDNVFSEYSSGALYLSSNYYGNTDSVGFKTSSTASFGAAGISVSGTSGAGTSGLIQFFVDPATSKTAGNAFTPTERARITSGGVLDIGTGAGAVGQIQFPATQVASSNANTLDDYEEGTWTPDATVGFTIVGATVASGSYTKIGNLVHVTGILGGATTIASAGGNTRITGMPFTSVSNSTCAVALVLDDISFLSSGLFAGTTPGIYVPAFSATAADLVFQFSYRV